MAGSDYYLMIISAHPPHWGDCLQFPILSPSFLISTQWRPVESPMNKGTFPLYLDLLPILHCRTSPHLALMNKNFSWVILIYLCGSHFSLLCSPKGGKVYASYFRLRFRIQFALLAYKLSSLLGYIKVLFFRWFFFLLSTWKWHSLLLLCPKQKWNSPTFTFNASLIQEILLSLYYEQKLGIQWWIRNKWI